jgi:hypothetical protein
MIFFSIWKTETFPIGLNLKKELNFELIFEHIFLRFENNSQLISNIS